VLNSVGVIPRCLVYPHIYPQLPTYEQSYTPAPPIVNIFLHSPKARTSAGFWAFLHSIYFFRFRLALPVKKPIIDKIDFPSDLT